MATWIENESERAGFWARAKELEFEHDEVHKVLNVNSMKEFTGTKAEAIAALTAEKARRDAAAKEKAEAEAAAAYTVTCQSLPEAPALAFTKFQTPNGFVWSLTTRAGLPELLEAQALKSVARQIKLFEAGALANGWTPISDGRDMAMGLKSRAESAPAPAPLNGGSKPTTPPLATGTPPPQAGQGPLTFSAEKLEATMNAGKTYWKVKGGKFSQYGVTIWPEVLTEAGFNPDALDPSQVYNIAGYSALYELNDKGKPGKVTVLKLVTN